jgi:membrane-bound lytic murein transglycosylase D
MSLVEKQALAGKAVPTNSSAQLTTASAPVETSGEFITYTVRQGDTLWDIAKLFENVTTDQILSLNNISDASKLKAGQKLKIRKKS